MILYIYICIYSDRESGTESQWDSKCCAMCLMLLNRNAINPPSPHSCQDFDLFLWVVLKGSVTKGGVPEMGVPPKYLDGFCTLQRKIQWTWMLLRFWVNQIISRSCVWCTQTCQKRPENPSPNPLCPMSCLGKAWVGRPTCATCRSLTMSRRVGKLCALWPRVRCS